MSSPNPFGGWWRVWAGGLAAAVVAADVTALVVSSPTKPFPWRDVAYGALIGAALLSGVLVNEYLTRRRFSEGLRRYLEAPADNPPSPFLPAPRRPDETLVHRALDRASQAARSAAGRAEAQARFERTFHARFAHDMKTPLFALSLLADEMARRATSPEDVTTEEVAPWIDNLASEVHRLDTSLTLLLETLRVSRFSVDARMERVDPLSLVRDAVNNLKGAFIRARLFPDLVTDGPVEDVSTDAKWLGFIVDQLLRNALQYGAPTRAGEPSKRLEVAVLDRGEAVEVRVRDEGIGISKRDLAHVFEPFFTGENGRARARATGMGLYLVQEVGRALAIQVAMASVVGEGTSVTLTIPRADYHRPGRLKKSSPAGSAS